MDNGNLNHKIQQNIKGDIEDIQEEMRKLEKDNGGKSLNSELDLLKSYINVLGRKDCLKGAEEIFRSITIAGNIESELDIIDDLLKFNLKPKGNTGITIPNASPSHSMASIQGYVGNLRLKIQKISKRLWQYLSHMMNLSEWSVSGNSNINICGFSGGVNLQLTFKT